MNLAYPFSADGWFSSGNSKYEGGVLRVGVWNIPALALTPPMTKMVGGTRAQLRADLARARRGWGGKTTEPAGFADPAKAQLTCPGAGACALGCFARQGRYLGSFGTVRKAWASVEFSTHPGFVGAIVADLRRHPYDLVRIHSSGDFYSASYRDAWFEIAAALPLTRFWAYTKSVPLFMDPSGRTLPGRPANLRIIYSLGSKHDKMVDVSRHVHSRVFDDHESLYDAGYADGTQNDAVVVFNNARIGLVYHGFKSLKGRITGTTTGQFPSRMGHEDMETASRRQRAKRGRGLDQPGVDPSPFR